MARAGYAPVIEYCGGGRAQRGGARGERQSGMPAHGQLPALQPCCPPCPAALPSAGTELGGAYFTGSLLQPQCPSTFSTPTVGHRPVILVSQQDGSQALSPHGDTAAVTGELALAAPALGTSQRLLNKDHRAAYYEGMPQIPGARWAAEAHRRWQGLEGPPGAQRELWHAGNAAARRLSPQLVPAAARRRDGAAAGWLLPRTRPCGRHNEPGWH